MCYLHVCTLFFFFKICLLSTMRSTELLCRTSRTIYSILYCDSMHVGCNDATISPRLTMLCNNRNSGPY